MNKRWLQFFRASEGATGIEYALIATLLAVVAITGVNLLGSKINSHYQSINNVIN